MAVTKLSNSGIKTGVLKYDSMLAGNAAYDPAATWLISRQTLSSNTETVTFSNIPQTYQHLQIRVMTRLSLGYYYPHFYFNGVNTGGNYAQHALTADGTSAGAEGSANSNVIQLASTGSDLLTNNFGVNIVDIHDYASTTKFKTVRNFGGYDNNGSGYLLLRSGVYRSTNAITSFSITTGFGAGYYLVSGTTIALYGFKG